MKQSRKRHIVQLLRLGKLLFVILFIVLVGLSKYTLDHGPEDRVSIIIILLTLVAIAEYFISRYIEHKYLY